MGLPVKFVCAVNVNDIVARMVNTGRCELGDVTPSLAPAMDMQVSICHCHSCHGHVVQCLSLLPWTCRSVSVTPAMDM